MDTTARTLVQYVRDENQNPIATLVAFKTLKSEKFIFGWSKYNLDKEDVPFSKEMGKELAITSGQTNTTVFITDPRLRMMIISRKNSANPKSHYRYIPRDIELPAYRFLARASKYFKCSAKNVKDLKTEELQLS